MSDLTGELWLPIAEIARIKKVSKQAISRRVAALVAAGKIETKAGERRTKLVNLAAYNVAIGETGDPAKELGAETKAAEELPLAPAPPDKPGYRDAQTRKTQYEADIKAIELGRMLGDYVSVAELQAAAAACAESIVRIIERGIARAGEIAAAVGSDGEAGARGKLREIVDEQRAAIAEAMNALAQLAPSAAEPDSPAEASPAEPPPEPPREPEI